MAQKHVERGNFAESAQCHVHAAALVAEHLAASQSGYGYGSGGHNEHMPCGAVDFLALGDDMLEESAVGDHETSSANNDACFGAQFTETGVCNNNKLRKYLKNR